MLGTEFSLTASVFMYLFTMLGSVVCIYLASKAKTQKNCLIYYSISLMLLLFLLGHRGFSPDYENYVSRFYLVQNNSFTQYLGFMEPVYLGLLFIITRFFPNNPQMMFFIYAFISLLLVYLESYRVRNEINPVIFQLVFVTVLFPLYFSFVRQGLAMSILIFGNRYLEDKKYFKYFLLTIISTLIHYSAIVMIGVLVMRIVVDKLELSLRKILMILLPSLLGFFLICYFITPILFGKFPWFERYAYMFDIGKLYISSIRSIAQFYLLIIVLIYYRKKLNFDSKLSFYLTQFVWLLSMVVVSFVFPIGRIGYYFYFYGLYLYAFLGKEIQNNNISYKIGNYCISEYAVYLTLLVASCSLWVLTKFILNPFWGPYLFPYYFNWLV
uniref:EpsG family protein n=1 Tax=Erysipelothrix tonsillarum TaxID=38402 RepID=A0A6S6I1U8_9FIRM|nr:EpsG family protein [Erysipelothrix tonsillarum]